MSGKPLYERRIIDGREVELVPTTLYFSETVPAGATSTISVAAQPGKYGEPLGDVSESKILSRLLGVPAIRTAIIESVGFAEISGPWFLVETDRRVLLPSAPDGKPGDFDLIVGGTREGHLVFDELAEVEFKIRRTDSEGNPKSAPLGIDQGRGAAACGFDRVVLAHVLVCEPPNPALTTPGWWNLVYNAAGSRRALEGNVAMMRAQCSDHETFGFMTMSLGQGNGGDPSRSGAIQPVNLWPAPHRPYALSAGPSAHRQQIALKLRDLLGDRRPWSAVFRLCRCGRLVAGENADVTCSGGHG
jgi:hypothetical protein